MRMRAWVFPLSVSILLLCKTGASAWASSGCRGGVKIFPAGHIGYNQLFNNFNGYSNYYTAGGDLYFTVAEKWASSTDGDCHDQIMLRLSGEYSPLKVPGGNNGLSEALGGLSANGIYRFGASTMEEIEWLSPYVGGGIGVVWDMTTVDTPATGKISSASHALDASFSLGVFGPRMLWLFRPNAEFRVHGTFIPSGMADNAEFVVGITLTPGSSGKKERRKINPEDVQTKPGALVPEKRGAHSAPTTVF